MPIRSFIRWSVIYRYSYANIRHPLLRDSPRLFRIDYVCCSSCCSRWARQPSFLVTTPKRFLSNKENGRQVEKNKTKDVAELAKKTLWQRFKAECIHYWSGMKLLWVDIKISNRLLCKVFKGRTLTRRERAQLVRTTADLFRLVPFLVLVIIPAGELLIPILLVVFPNMLPSTFTEKDKEEEKIRKRFKLKLEMTKFLQDTIESMPVHKKETAGEGKTAHQFAEFINQVRTGDRLVTNEEIMKYATLFENEITLDNLTRGQLQALCRILEMGVIGPNVYLKYQLEVKLRSLEADDRMILKEGVDALEPWELQAICRSRGMRAVGMPTSRLKENVKQWLELHLEKKIPVALLLLSRALYLPENVTAEDKLAATISALPDTAAEEAIVKAAEKTGEKVDNKSRLNIIKQEEAIIKEEKVEKKKEAADKAKELVDKAAAIESKPEEVLEDKAEDVVGKEELKHIEAALQDVAQKHEVDFDQKGLVDLKEDIEDFHDDMSELKSAAEVKESKAAKRLRSRVDKLITDMNVLVDQLDSKKSFYMKELKKEGIGEQEKQESQKNVASINEVIESIRKLQKTSDDDRLEQTIKIANALDDDDDGQITISNALKVIELIGKQRLEKDKIVEVVSLVRKEQKLEEEEELLETQNAISDAEQKKGSPEPSESSEEVVKKD